MDGQFVYDGCSVTGCVDEYQRGKEKRVEKKKLGARVECTNLQGPNSTTEMFRQPVSHEAQGRRSRLVMEVMILLRDASAWDVDGPATWFAAWGGSFRWVNRVCPAHWFACGLAVVSPMSGER